MAQVLESFWKINVTDIEGTLKQVVHQVSNQFLSSACLRQLNTGYGPHDTLQECPRHHVLEGRSVAASVIFFYACSEGRCNSEEAEGVMRRRY